MLSNNKIRNIIGYFIVIVINIFIFFNLRNFDFNLSIPIQYSGDFLSAISVFKQIMVGEFPFFGIPISYHLASPFQLEFGDYPLPMMSVWLFIKLIGLFSNDVFLVINIFILSTFILNPLAMYFILRRLRINLFITITIATLFNVIPFHFFRIEHIFYIGYFLLPILTYILLLMITKKPLLYKFSIDKKKYIFDFSKRNIFIIGILLFASTWNYYYTFFFAILLGVVFLILLINKKNRYFFNSTFIVLSLSVLPFIINMIPYKMYTIENGKNLQVAQRGIGESEIYALKISQLLLPVDGHRVEKLFQLKNRYNTNVPLINENGTATLGIIGSLGFLLLILYLLIQTKTLTTIKKLSYFNIAVLLFTTVGGFASLFALLITPSIRGYNRVSIFIATFALIAFAIAFNYLIKRYRIELWKIILFSISLTSIGLYDQIPKGISLNTNYSKEVVFISDKKFIQQIEELHTKNERGMIIQYPYMSYPEQPTIVNMQNYSQMIGYLHSDTLKWSYGAVPGRESDRWIKSLNKEIIEKQIEILKSSGFTGIYIDRRGYQDNAKSLENQLSNILNIQPLVSDDNLKSFFKLIPIGNTIYEFGYLPEFINGFYGWEGEEGIFGWTSGNSTLKLYNNKNSLNHIHLSFKLSTLQKRSIEIFHGNQLIEKIELNPSEKKKIDLDINSDNSKNMIYFKTDTISSEPGNGDIRKISFSVSDMEIEYKKISENLNLK